MDLLFFEIGIENEDGKLRVEYKEVWQAEIPHQDKKPSRDKTKMQVPDCKLSVEINA